ncbi:MAG: DUF5606 domain-containing protein [Chitinophagaceae bacterium]|jgi:outer membrane biosynthesis protein TonB|nr:DUF5606 domain-containing protein [Chitinophagaceae bacterium]
MDYSKMISVSGMPGLFELLSSKNDGALLRSLSDKTTKFVSSRVHQFSHLESIEVYTQRENVNLVDVFKAMDESSESLPSEKDNTAIKKYFEKVYPDMDFDRVYTSDMKKMVKWFDALKTHDIEIKLSEQEEEEETIIEEPEIKKEKPVKEVKAKQEKVKEEKPKEDKKPVVKKSATAKSDTATQNKKETKPTKAAKKKKSD